MFETRQIPLKRLDRSRAHDFSYLPAKDEIPALEKEYGWRKSEFKSFKGKLLPRDDGWELIGNIKAKITQNCVISAAPVYNTLDLDIRRLFLREWNETQEETALADDFDADIEKMPQNLDLEALLCESILLELPEYPKLKKYQGGELWQYQDEPSELENTAPKRPFADLKAQMEKKKKG